jgi:hypothetical protein
MAATFADSIQLCHRLVEPRPQLLRAAATGSRLELVGRLGTAPGGRPFESVAGRRLARLGTLTSCGGEASESSAEAGVRRRQYVLSERSPPDGARVGERLL